MSGAEAATVLGIVSAAITIYQVLRDVYETIEDTKGLPRELRTAAEQIGFVEYILQQAQANIKDERVGDLTCAKAKPIFSRCERAAMQLKSIFDKCLPLQGDSYGTRVRKAFSVKRKSGEVKKTMEEVMQDLDLLHQLQVYHNADAVIRVKYAVDNIARQSQTQATTSFSNTPTLASCIIPFPRDPDFITRTDLTDRLQQKLSSRTACVALAGLGGTGKTSLAIEYCHWMRSQTPEVWVLWFHASNLSRFEQSLREIVDFIKLPGRDDPNANIQSLLLDWLRDRRNGDWLIVLDNTDDPGFLIEGVSPSIYGSIRSIEHGKMLITTRSESAALQLVDRSCLIKVEAMGEKVAVELLQKKLGQGHGIPSLIKLADALDFMPLAMTQAAAYIAQRGSRCTVNSYLEMLLQSNESGKSILDHDAGDLRRDKESSNSVMLTWQISFEHVQKIRPSAANLLSLMSFFDRNDIPEFVLRAPIDDDDNSGQTDKNGELADCDSKNSGQRWHKSYSDDDFEDDIILLQSFAFVSTTEDVTAFKMHRLVQIAMKRWLVGRDNMASSRDQFISLLSSVFPSGEFETWKTCQRLLPHVKIAENMVLEDSHPLEPWARLLSTAAWYAIRKCDYADAENMSTKVYSTTKRLLGEENFETVRSMCILAAAKAEQGYTKQAEELETVVLKIWRRVLGEEHPDTLSTMHNLALTYNSQGRYNEAEKLQTVVIRVQRRELGEDHPHTLSTMNNLATIYHSQGRYNEAEKLQTIVLTVRRRKLGEEYPDTLLTMHNLASIYHSQGRYNEAEKLETIVIRVQKRELGEEHPETLSTMNNLAMTYHSQGRYNKAEELQTMMLRISRRVLGEKHPDVLVAIHTLAQIFQAQGKWDEAEELLEGLIPKMGQALGPTHPETLDIMNDLADLHRLQGRQEEAGRLEGRVLEALEEHQSSCKCKTCRKHLGANPSTMDHESHQRQLDDRRASTDNDVASADDLLHGLKTLNHEDDVQTSEIDGKAEQPASTSEMGFVDVKG